jgi:quercetin dioxygenase-like cupin family protein
MARSIPDPRLVITGHDEAGISVFHSDTIVSTFYPFGPTISSFSVLDIRGAVPANNSDAIQDYPEMLPRCPPNGISFGITNIPANFTVPMHRTLSLDYGIVMDGEIVLKLDNGIEKVIKTGEFIIQRGTNHQWINRTDETCRIAFVMIGATKVKLANGTELDEIEPKR